MNEPDGRVPAAVALLIVVLGSGLGLAGVWFLSAMHAAATGRGVW